MISFRYHLVSIVAVFLAIAVGILVGTTVLDQGIVATLESRTRALSATAADLRRRIEAVEAQLDRNLAAAEQILPTLITGELSGTEVVIVSHEGVDDGLVDRARAALDMAGASVLAELSMTSRMTPSDAPTRRQLADILGSSLATPDALAAQAGIDVADRLADGPDALATADPDEDLLARLLSGGFLVSGSELGADDLAAIDGDGQVIVVLAGGRGQPLANPGPFLVPLVEELVRVGVNMAAGESATGDYRFVTVIRGDSRVAGSDDLVTVDDLDEPFGAAALVLGLDELLLSGRGGHYGFKAGATAELPLP